MYRFFFCVGGGGGLSRKLKRFVSKNFPVITDDPLYKLILKTIWNRKGDRAWSCSRWHTQPKKICKSQRTNQCHSLCKLYWFVLCNLQIFSDCVFHLEQLHAQSPFLFAIVFCINLILFSIFPQYLLFFHAGCSGMCYFTSKWATVRSQQLLFVALAAGLWCLFHCWMPRQISPLPRTPTPSQTGVSSTMGESIRLSSFHNPTRDKARRTNLPVLAISRRRWPCRQFRWASNPAFQRHWKIAQLRRSPKD